MKIVFISYWGLNDGLTASTVLPHVDVLASYEKVEDIFLCTIERDQFHSLSLNRKVKHVALRSKYPRNIIANKVYDFFFFPRIVARIVRHEKVELVICRGSMAGAIGYRVSKQTGIPFVVESFEPHSTYMAESGVWPRYGLRFLIQRTFEKIICRSATFLLPVANGYAEELISKGVDAKKVHVVPCVVDLKKFQPGNRKASREKLNLKQDVTIGIYVGKFGGMYYDDEAILIFKKADGVFKNFYLLILTPDNSDSVTQKLLLHGFSQSKFMVAKAPHDQVPLYMIAADFAFATYKKSYSKKFLSPVKVGEYWACGLPVLLTEGVGDDAEIIERNNCGATFSLEKDNVTEGLVKIRQQLSDPDCEARNFELAHKFRNPKLLERAYQIIIQPHDASSQSS